MSKEIKNKWAVFRLNEAVSGISNKGMQHSEDEFTLSREYDMIFSSEVECEGHIRDRMNDYSNRSVGKGVRFISLPVYFYEDDEIFK